MANFYQQQYFQQHLHQEQQLPYPGKYDESLSPLSRNEMSPESSECTSSPELHSFNSGNFRSASTALPQHPFPVQNSSQFAAFGSQRSDGLQASQMPPPAYPLYLWGNCHAFGGSYAPDVKPSGYDIPAQSTQFSTQGLWSGV
ncbi:hypothetical protein DPMN_120776 [Dreissena polymorpha]|uniref:Uncharacterized protein n=2 Tax=Dreissena polymorpha TaxID=45954 RepID=A0A9D4GKF1_DREPO|nr:hypothetical protein DPMN_120776 [Dreissena polymorpha]